MPFWNIQSWLMFQTCMVCHSENVPFLIDVLNEDCANFVILGTDDKMSFQLIIAIFISENNNNNKQANAIWLYLRHVCPSVIFSSGSFIQQAGLIWQSLKFQFDTWRCHFCSRAHLFKLKHVSRWYMFQNGTKHVYVWIRYRRGARTGNAVEYIWIGWSLLMCLDCGHDFQLTSLGFHLFIGSSTVYIWH